MKKIITISVDVDLWSQAKESGINISSYLNECLKNATGIPEVDKKLIDLQAQKELLDQDLNKLYAKKSALDFLLKQKILEQENEKKQQIENEQFNRWNCGACHHLNFMDRVRCDNCHLPTKTDSKTTIVNIKGD